MNEPGAGRIDRLQVLGRAFTDVAHDIQNHLAAVNESAGWMGDLLWLKTKPRFGWIGRVFGQGKRRRFDVAPLSHMLKTIEGVVGKGSTLNQRFSSFADTLEQSRSVFSGHKALGVVSEVLAREAGEKGLLLELRMEDSASMIEADPFGFQLAVFSVADMVMEGLERGDRVVLETEAREGRFQISLASPSLTESRSLDSGDADDDHFCRGMVERLGGRILKQTGDGGIVTTMAFPLASGETEPLLSSTQCSKSI